MRRLMKDERGAVAVIVALIMVVLMAFAALAIDVSAGWSEKKQLQNGADAGALAIAQACAKGACGIPSNTARDYAVANRNSGTATGSAVVDMTKGKVTVTTSDPHEHWFAKVIDPDGTTPVGARATAKWGSPIGGTTLPLTFSYCEWNTQFTGPGGLDNTTEKVVLFSKKSTSMCTGPSGLVVPGGFGWVKTTTTGECDKASMINQIIDSDTGNVPPSGCTNADFLALLNTTILIPIFDQWSEKAGNNAYYHLYGYAAFKFTGYFFNNTFKSSPAPCGSPDRCVKGYFTKYVALDEAFDVGSGPSLGLSIVSLTLN